MGNAYARRYSPERPLRKAWKIVKSSQIHPIIATKMDTPKYGETLKFLYIRYQPILVNSFQRFTKFNYGVTRTMLAMKANHFEPALRPNH